MRNTPLIILFLFLPALVFSQGVNKTNLGFMVGLSVPVTSKDFRNTHKAGFNFNINVDHTITESLLLGGELDFANQLGAFRNGSTAFINSDEDRTYRFISLDAYMKLQNNLAREEEGQFFVKAGGGGTILKTTTGGSSIGVQQISTSLPDKFYLSQNYPNPFNPATVISFQLPAAGFVKLKVFDLLGREIANLVNENLSAGSYKYDFNASALTSGIYFYKLEAENFSETRKMVLVK